MPDKISGQLPPPEETAEPRINRLPEVVQNKIAAGEVVERPASVVKELVENSLDAGATSITVEIEEGGMRLLRVSDDGRGMGAQNLELCIERHATSKIREVEDIFHIRTMGFRGEALPSIGAVSRLSISSCLPGEAAARCLRLTGGNKEGISPAPPRRGTVVEVRDLFFNTPARRKFMKSPAAEVAAISETLTRLALANPQIGFCLSNNRKRVLELPAHEDLRARICALFGKNLRLLPVERSCGEDGELVVSGFCARPPESRANSRFIYTFMNQRWIRHPGLARAVAEAYQGSLPPRRYPFAVLRLEIDPARIDVNAHPTKEIVRFENESLIVGGTCKAVREALAGASFINEVEQARSTEGAQELRTRAAEAAAAYISNNRHTPQAMPPRQPQANARSIPHEAGHAPGARPHSAMHGQPHAPRPPFTDREHFPPRPQVIPQNLPGSLPQSWRDDAENTNTNGNAGRHAMPPHGTDVRDAGGESAQVQQDMLVEGLQGLRFIGQAGQRYLLVERADGLLLVDQHALHERWNYDRLRERRREIAGQRLLLPLQLTLTPAEAATAGHAAGLLREMGFELTQAGENELVISAHPEIIPAHKIEQAVRDVLSDLEQTPLEDFEQHLCASLACHSAVLFGKALAPEACLALLEKYRDGQLLSCPHGRPTSIFYSWQELASRFGR